MQARTHGIVCSFSLQWSTILTSFAFIISVSLFPACSSDACKNDGEMEKVVWMIPMDLDRRHYERLLDRFHELHPEIRVAPRWVPASQYQTKFKILAAAGLEPDVFMAGDVWAAYLAPFLLDLTPFVERDREALDLEDIPPRLLEACQYEGSWWMMPRSFTVSLLYYNTDIFDAANEPYPNSTWTWDEYFDAARRLTRETSDARASVWGSTIVTGWWGEWLTLVRQAGGRLFDEEITRCLLDSPESLEAIRFYMSKIEGGIAPAPGRGPALGFEGGRYAMHWGGHTNEWASLFGKLENLNWDVELLPSGPAGTRGAELAIDAYGVARTTDVAEASWQLVKFLASSEAAELNAQYGFLVARQSVLESVFADPENPNPPPRNWRCIYMAIETAESIPRSPNFIEIAIDVIQPEFDRMTAGLLSPDEACVRATAAANAYIRVLSR